MSRSNEESQRPKDLSRIDQDAATWLVRQDNGPLTELQQKAFDRWYQESELHRASYRSLSTLWSGMERIGANKVNLDAASLKPTRMESLGFEVRHRVVASLAVAVLGLSALFAVLVVDNFPGAGPHYAQSEYRTVTGDQKSIELPDGSSVLLNTASHVRVAYAADQRIIYLLKGRELFFC